jgi:hypothetical protein
MHQSASDTFERSEENEHRDHRNCSWGRGWSRGAPWARWQGLNSHRLRHDGAGHHAGNAAFEAYKARELEKLDEMRRKLIEEERAFGEFLARLKRAKDQEEFDRFMAERSAPQEPPVQ